MAYSIQQFTSTGTEDHVILSFPYLDKMDIHVYGNSVETAFVWASDTRIDFPPFPTGTEVVIRRLTQRDRVRYLLQEGAPFTREVLDQIHTQALYLAQESIEGAWFDIYGDVDMHGFRIRNAGNPELPQDYTTRQWVESQILAAELGDGTLATQLIAEAFEALRRTYAEVGVHMLGRFQAGATITTTQTGLVDATTGLGYVWRGALPKHVPVGSTPTSSGGIGPTAWELVSTDLLRTQLAEDTGAGMIGTSSGSSVQSSIDAMRYTQSHRYYVRHKVPHRFIGYTDVMTAEGYTYLYATGHTYDHTANELWVAYQAEGGDTAQWYVVYDLPTMTQKRYFRCGRRWTKTFSLHYHEGMRKLYGRGANGYLAVFDVTTLPTNGDTLPELNQPKSNIGALFSSVMGDELLVAHRGQTTNTQVEFNTYLAVNPSTFEHTRVYRLNTVTAGDTDGTDQLTYKTQGLCFYPSGIAVAYGGFVGASEESTKAVALDYRSIQGVALLSPTGQWQFAGLFDPFKAMSVLAATGLVVNRFETEGLNYDSATRSLTTLWHTDGSDTSTLLVVEAFSEHPNAIDLSDCAVAPFPCVPPVMSLYRDDQNGPHPHDPVTGAALTDVTHLCSMMMRYDQRELVWYTSNFSSLGFNGGTLVGSAKARLLRGNNTTFFLNVRSAGADQEWVIQVSGTVFTYTRLDAYAVTYRFEGTLSGDFIGNGSPEGVVVASPGSTYRNRLGGAGTTLYVKESGAGTSVGWVAK